MCPKSIKILNGKAFSLVIYQDGPSPAIAETFKEIIKVLIFIYFAIAFFPKSLQMAFRKKA